MSGVSRYLLMFKLSESGDLELIDPSPDNLTSQHIILILDEINSAVWLWTGGETSLIKKRIALRMANSLKTYGYHYKNMLVGRGCRNLIQIDENELESPEVKNQYNKLMDTLSNIQITGMLGSSKEEKIKVKQVKIPEHVTIIKPQEETKEAPAQIETQQIKQPPAAITFLTSTDLKEQVKAGTLIASALDRFSELRIKKISQEGKTYYELEVPEKKILKFIVSNGEISFKEGDETILKDVKEKYDRIVSNIL